MNALKTRSLGGVTVATVLPFTSAGDIDWPSFARLLDYCAMPDGIAAVFVNGHAGESARLTPAERIDVVRFARRHIGAGKCLVAGLVAESTVDAIRQARDAKAAGADVLTVFPLTPAPHEAAGEAALAHVQAIGEAVELPLAVFQYPISSPASHSTATLVAMAQLPWVVGIKEGSDSIGVYEDNWRAVKAADPQVGILASNFDWFLAQLATGSDGILSGLASVVPQQLAALWSASVANDLDAMRVTSDTLHELVRAVYAAPRADMYRRIKCALHLMGVIDSPVSRGEVSPLDQATVARLYDALLRAGLAPASLLLESTT